jgi:alcohol dehydrogenase class IV
VAAALDISTAPFRWNDGDRVIRFGRGALADAPELVGEDYVLLTTARAREHAPELVERAAAVHEVPEGRVDEIAAELRPTVAGETLVALGGGRVIDVAKALAAADPPRRVAAIPTSLSAAEMTGLHRHAAGVPVERPRVRPAIVINDPAASASQSQPALAASALNSLAHAVEAPLTVLANPAATLVAHGAVRLLAGGFATEEPDRDALALGALLAGWSADAAGYGLHHVMSQTLARLTPAGHGPANAVMLPHTLPALQRRFPAELAAMAAAAGDDLPSIAARIGAHAGPMRLRERGVTAAQLAECADAAVDRPELHLTPPPADRDELLALYEAAW